MVQAAATKIDSNSAGDSVPANSTYYTVRPIVRRCASPLCGGYFVKRVNQSSTRCSDGKHAAQCYVAEIDWNHEPSVQPKRALLRGEIVSKQLPRVGKVGIFRVRESWEAASDKTPTGAFYRVRDRGVRCIAHPCLTHSEAQLNSTSSSNIAGVDLQKVEAESTHLTGASTAMTAAEGVLVAGTHTRVSGPAGNANILSATQFYLRATKETAEKPCIRTGCSNQICAEEEVVTTCEYRLEYECYKKAKCERQADGNCGFTKTSELTACINRFQRKSGD